jgi:hypothetical protein
MGGGESPLGELFEDVPHDLMAYFDAIRKGAVRDSPKHEVRLLDAGEAVKWSKEFREFHPIVYGLGGVVLDDPNTSNHHVYLSRQPFSGIVLFLCHDGESSVVFGSLVEFLNAIQAAVRTNRFLTDLHPPHAVVVKDQAALSELLRRLLDEKCDFDPEPVILAAIPSMDLSDLEILDNMASHDDFYIAEAVAIEIARRPNPALLRIAEKCAKHPHFQASHAGERAVSAITAK